MKRNLKSVAQFCTDGPFTQNQIRWWIFNAAKNGLNESQSVVRLQRRVFIDVDKFDAWIDAQQPQQAAQ